MSKNTSSNKFRKVNIEEFDPDQFKDETVDGEEQGPSETDVNALLTQYPFKFYQLYVVIIYTTIYLMFHLISYGKAS